MNESNDINAGTEKNAKREFVVHVSITLSDSVAVDAANESDARQAVEDMLTTGNLLASEMTLSEQKVWID